MQYISSNNKLYYASIGLEIPYLIRCHCSNLLLRPLGYHILVNVPSYLNVKDYIFPFSKSLASSLGLWFLGIALPLDDNFVLQNDIRLSIWLQLKAIP